MSITEARSESAAAASTSFKRYSNKRMLLCVFPLKTRTYIYKKKSSEIVNLQVVKAHKASFNYSVVFKKGDRVKIEREDPEMPGWFWCENEHGIWAWVPDEFIDRHHKEGMITHDYDTTELTTAVGDLLEYVAEVKFWTLCRTSQGEKGWVPTNSLKRI